METQTKNEFDIKAGVAIRAYNKAEAEYQKALMAWGNAPEDSPEDRALDAAIERRNDAYGAVQQAYDETRPDKYYRAIRVSDYEGEKHDIIIFIDPAMGDEDTIRNERGARICLYRFDHSDSNRSGFCLMREYYSDDIFYHWRDDDDKISDDFIRLDGFYLTKRVCSQIRGETTCVRALFEIAESDRVVMYHFKP